jgi:hypothetical protein
MNEIGHGHRPESRKVVDKRATASRVSLQLARRFSSCNIARRMYISISKWICNKTKCLRPLNFFTLIGGGYLSLLWMTFSANFNALNPLLLLDTLLAPSVCATLRRKTHRFKIEHLSCPVLSGKIVRVRLVQCLAEQAVQRDLSRYMNRRPQPSELTNCRSQPS